MTSMGVWLASYQKLPKEIVALVAWFPLDGTADEDSFNLSFMRHSLINTICPIGRSSSPTKHASENRSILNLIGLCEKAV